MIDISEFHGEVPKLSDKLLPNNYASSAINCNIEEGNLQPVLGTTSIQAVGAGVETIYRAGEEWLQWSNKINVVETPVYNSGGRILFTGGSYPKETNILLALSSAPYPTATRRLGITAPTVAPTAAITVAGSGATRSIAYCYTVIGEWADGTVVESAPSPTTDVFDALTTGVTVTIDDFVAPTDSGVYFTHYRIYRINTGDTGAEYQYVDDLIKTASPLEYDDTVLDDDLGEVLPTEGWTDPIDDLQGIIPTSDGLIFGFNNNNLYVSESFIHYAFPIEYSNTIFSEIVGLGFNGNAVVVLTKTKPVLVYGSDPESLSIDQSPADFPCKSARSIVSYPGGVLFSSSAGIVLVDSGGLTSNMTESIFTKTQWEALGPENVFAFYFNGAYVAFFEGTTTGIEIKIGSNETRRFETDRIVFGGAYVSTVNINLYDFVTSTPEDFITTDGYQYVVSGDAYSLTYDTLYLISETDSAREIVSWESGSLKDYTWESKEFVYPNHQIFTAGKIVGDFTEGDVALKLYIDGSLVFSKTVSSEDVFRISNPTRGREFKVTLSGKATIDQVRIGASVVEVLS